MTRYTVAWVAVGLLALACFAPWATVTTAVNVTENHGALEDAFFGGFYLLGLAAVAALGLLFRWPTLTMTCAVLAVILVAVFSAGTPETMVQFGYMAELAWGAYVAFASSLTLVFAARPVSKIDHRAVA